MKTRGRHQAANFLLLIILSISTAAFADVEFFASNNTHQIDLEVAFKRLRGEEQRELQNASIDLMQKKRIEQSKFEDVLGTYRMSSDQKVTADNTEKIITSSYEELPSKKVFKLAKKLAIMLKQESVAVFIGAQKPLIADVILKLKSHPYTIKETVAIIREKLPPQYSQAFSLHLSHNMCASFDGATVEEVEWLGSQANPDEIKRSFPQEEVSSYYGKAYLVYKDGRRERL
ncbi:MAG: exported protein of unknown function [Gammaproteobacteria bacterium]|jgi:hypothetical protein|nr:exported protein of unknown function [Gammaproteobacteria bacterium]